MGGTLILRGLALAMTALLAACGSLVDLPGSGPAPQIYTLSVPAPARIYAARDWRLLVDEPDASRTLDTARIAVWTSPVEVSYLKNALWSDRVPSLLQGLFVQTIDAANTLQLVARGTVGMKAHYLLKSNLQAFQVENFTGKRNVRVRIKFLLVEQSSADILASKVMESTVRTKSSGAKAIALAFDEAMGVIAPEMMDWVLATIDAKRAATAQAESAALLEDEDANTDAGNDESVSEGGNS